MLQPNMPSFAAEIHKPHQPFGPEIHLHPWQKLARTNANARTGATDLLPFAPMCRIRSKVNLTGSSKKIERKSREEGIDLSGISGISRTTLFFVSLSLSLDIYIYIPNVSLFVLFLECHHSHWPVVHPCAAFLPRFDRSAQHLTETNRCSATTSCPTCALRPTPLHPPGVVSRSLDMSIHSSLTTSDLRHMRVVSPVVFTPRNRWCSHRFSGETLRIDRRKRQSFLACTDSCIEGDQVSLEPLAEEVHSCKNQTLCQMVISVVF